MVAGPRGSVSNDMHELIKEIAEVGAEQKWRTMGARSMEEARGVIKGALKRRIGITAARAAARLIIARAGIVRGDAKAAARRRNNRHNERRTAEDEWYFSEGAGAHAGGGRRDS